MFGTARGVLAVGAGLEEGVEEGVGEGAGFVWSIFAELDLVCLVTGVGLEIGAVTGLVGGLAVGEILLPGVVIEAGLVI